MALFFYGGRRRYSSRYRSGRSFRRAYSSTSRSQRRAIRNQKAAVQQRDQGEVVLNIPTKVDVFNGSTEIRETDINGVAEPYDIRNGVYALNIWELMRKSEFYQSYANMYDQVKLDKVTVKLTPYQFPIVNYGYQAGITNYYNSYTIVTAWDRTGLSPEQTRWVISRGTLDDNRKTVIGTEADGDGLYIDITGSAAATYSSAIQRNINPNSSTASITRSIYPTTIAEKAYWVNTSELKEWYNGYDGERGRFYGLVDPGGVATRNLAIPLNPEVNVPQYPLETTGSISNVHTRNPCYIQESSQVPFKPTLLIGLLNDPINVNVAGMAQQQQLTPRMKFNVECDCVVTFRGLRKASIVEGKSTTVKSNTVVLSISNEQLDEAPLAPEPGNLRYKQINITNLKDINEYYGVNQHDLEYATELGLVIEQSRKIRYLQIFAGNINSFAPLDGPIIVTPAPISLKDNVYYSGDQEVGVELTKRNEQAFVLELHPRVIDRSMRVKYFTFSYNVFGATTYVIPRMTYYMVLKREDEPPISDVYTGNTQVRFFDREISNDEPLWWRHTIFAMASLNGFTTIQEASNYASMVEINENTIEFDITRVDYGD